MTGFYNIVVIKLTPGKSQGFCLFAGSFFPFNLRVMRSTLLSITASLPSQNLSQPLTGHNHILYFPQVCLFLLQNKRSSQRHRAIAYTSLNYLTIKYIITYSSINSESINRQMVGGIKEKYFIILNYNKLTSRGQFFPLG